MDATLPVTLLSVLVGLAALAALGIVLRTAPGQVGARHLAYPVAAMAVVGLVFTFVLMVVTPYSAFFATAHLVYLVAVLAGPALGAALLVSGAVRGARAAIWVVAVALLVPAPLGWYATHVVPNHLEVDREAIDLPSARTGSQPIEVGIMADLQTNHIGDHEQRAVTMLLAEHPDVILIAGDFFQGDDAQFARELPAFRRLLARLHAPGGVFAVRGDVDPGDNLDRLVVGTRVHILDNEVVVRKIRDRTVAIGGNKLLWAPPEARAVRAELLAEDPGVIRIMMAHRPDIALDLKHTDEVDLTVAGHTHGGQVALPFYGPVVTFTKVPRRLAWGGLHRYRRNWVYVTPGVGLERNQAPQVRFLTTPSVGLITLR